MTKLIKDLFGLANVDVKNFPKAIPQPNPCPSLLYGVELEIENVPNYDAWNVPGLFTERDGSLRNNGIEFISLPMTYSNLYYCLNGFFSKNRPDASNYSDRTSIHVHTNCQDLTWDQLQGICLVYQTLEKMLFAWVGGDRDKNIFCVPWHQTNMTYNVLKVDQNIAKFKTWQKYTALNLLPLYTQGTIEWRHMYGHGDFQKLMLWCKLIGHIYAYVKATPLEAIKENILTLNVSSEYEALLYAIFREDAYIFTTMPKFAMALEEGILETKFGLIENAPAPFPSFADIVARPPAAIRRAQIAPAPRFRVNVDPVVQANWAAGNPLRNDQFAIHDELARIQEEIRNLRPEGENV